jgi:hypothetical protein
MTMADARGRIERDESGAVAIGLGLHVWKEDERGERETERESWTRGARPRWEEENADGDDEERRIPMDGLKIDGDASVTFGSGASVWCYLPTYLPWVR